MDIVPEKKKPRWKAEHLHKTGGGGEEKADKKRVIMMMEYKLVKAFYRLLLMMKMKSCNKIKMIMMK